MNTQQSIVILSPCLFTRTGMESGLKGTLGERVLTSAFRLPDALPDLATLPEPDVLILHLTPLLSTAEWRCLDEVLCRQWGTCRLLVLHEPESTSMLSTMRCLRRHGVTVASSAVTMTALTGMLKAMLPPRVPALRLPPRQAGVSVRVPA